MPIDRLTGVVNDLVARMEEQGTAKGAEVVVREVVPAAAGQGPRFLLEGQGDKHFIRMNANSYLGLSLHPEVIEAEEATARAMGAGPGAVRFIAGTHTPHVALERDLAEFHGREEGMIFSSAYAAVVSAIASLTDKTTFVISDELNHNCIINAIRMTRPAGKAIYPHLDLAALDRQLEEAKGRARRVIVVTDGIFSMRGDHAPVNEIMAIAERHDADYPENVVVVVDDSHGVGAFGATGRGTEEYTNSPPCDILGGTLGKAFGVNGGYVVSSAPVIRFLRESSPLYIYSNPHHRGGGRRSAQVAGDPAGSGRDRAAPSPARADETLRDGAGGGRLRDHPGRPSHHPHHGARHRRDAAPGGGPLRRRRAGHRARLPGRAPGRRIDPLPDQRGPHRSGDRRGACGAWPPPVPPDPTRGYSGTPHKPWSRGVQRSDPGQHRVGRPPQGW